MRKIINEITDNFLGGRVLGKAEEERENELLTLTQNTEDGKGRIANALSVNIAARKKSDLFSNYSEEDKEKLTIRDKDGKLVDRKGKPLYLNVEEIQLIKALSSYLPFYSKEVKEAIMTLDTMTADGSIKGEFNPVQIPISVWQLSKDIIGNTKEASLKKIENLLMRLEQIEQAQIFHINGEKYEAVRPLIRLTDKIYKYYSEIRSTKGRKKADPDEGGEKILIAANVIYTSLFLYKATKEYCPLYKERLFGKIWKENKTEMFAIILSDLESKWRQYYIASIKAGKRAEEEYKNLRKEDKSEFYRHVAEEKKKALIYTEYTATIRERLTIDYEKSRAQRSRFIPDLQRAISSLVEYGIITDESRITKDKQKVLFFYNPNFLKDDMRAALPNSEI